MIREDYMGIKIEYMGIVIDDKEAALLRTIFESKEYEFRDRAMRALVQNCSTNALSCIINNHPEYEFRDRAMRALANK
jgi:hypothetical protein